MKRSWLAGLLALTWLWSTQARAERVDIERPRRERVTSPSKASSSTQIPRYGWYGAPLLVIDGLSFGAVAAGLRAESKTLTFGGLTGYFLGGPVVHLAQGHSITALESLGLRVLPVALAVPLVDGALDEVQGAEGNDGTCEVQCAAVFLLLIGGTLTAATVDDVVLARHPTPSSGWTPYVDASGGRRTLGLRGTF